MKFENALTRLLNIEFPLIQAGMIWASGWKLASAVSNAGGLGVLGAGSMYPDVLRHHIEACKRATTKPFGVNLPLLYPDIDTHVETIVDTGVPVVITSAGNPAKYTQMLREAGIVVLHVVSSSRFAKKAEDCGCHAVIAEGFEAGGHNGREETTSMVLLPLVRQAVSIPVVAAGGIATGRQMFAAMVLGADGVQMGSRFVASLEASSHAAFKEAVTRSAEGDTVLTLKELTPVRLLKNSFYDEILALKASHATPEDYRVLLGRGRAKRGMFEGDLENGELEIGQVSAMIRQVKPAAEIVAEVRARFFEALENPLNL